MARLQRAMKRAALSGKSRTSSSFSKEELKKRLIRILEHAEHLGWLASPEEASAWEWLYSKAFGGRR